MSKQLAVSFMIGASLGSGFQNTMSAAAKQFQTLGASAKDMAALASRAGSYQGLLGKVKGDRGKLAQLRAQAKALKGLQGAAPQTKRLNDQILRLEANLSKDIQTLRKWSGELKGAGVDTRKLGEEQGRLQQQSERASSALARLSAAQSRLGETRQKLSWSSMKGSVIASGAMLMALKAPVAVAADFEQAMARVEAVSFGGRAEGGQVAALAAMREQALALGSTTRFTAMEAAQSQENLARAGFRSNEIIAAMPGLLDMAAAEGMDLAAAADIASSTLRGFRLEADQAGLVADVLAKASASSNTNIAELGEAMKYVAPLAAALGVSVEETAALLGTMANAGIKGSQGGTSLKAAFVRLAREPKMTEAALRDLGVASRDARGRLRTLPSIMEALSEKMRGMGEADQTKALTRIFGSEAAPGMVAIMNSVGTGDHAKLEEEIRVAHQEGTARAMAAVMGDTTQGAWTRLSSAWEGLMVTVGDVIAPGVRLMSDLLAQGIGWLTEMAREFPTVTKAIVGGFAGLGIGVIGASVGKIVILLGSLPGQIAAVMAAKKAATDAIGAAASGAAGAAGKAGAGAGAGIGGAVALAAVGIPVALAVAEKYMSSHDALTEALDAEAEAGDRASQAALVQAIARTARTGFEDVSIQRMGLGAEMQGALDKLLKTKQERFVDAVMASSKETLAAKKLDVKREDVAQWGSTLAEAMRGQEDAIRALPDALRLLVEELAAMGAAPSPAVAVPGHARGGLFTRPHVGMIGEAGPEAVIPLTDRARGISLWRAAGERLGVARSSETVAQTFSPTFNINIEGGGADADGLARRVKDAVLDALAAMRANETRVAY